MNPREGYYSEQVRNEALQSILGNLGFMQKSVYEVIRIYGPATNEEIAFRLKKYPHTITARVKELRELGLVEFAGKKESEVSGRFASLWKVTSLNPQLNLF